MALEESGGGIPATMLVGPTGVGGGMPYPVYSGGNGNGNNGGWESGWWIILLFILLASNGWGNNTNAGGGNAPYIINDGNGGSVQRGFDQAAIMTGVNGLNSGIQNLSTQLCNCCADMTQTVNSGFANAETAANARAMANMQQMFGLQSQFADCCCENRLATADLKYTIATENCADRAAVANGIRDVIENCNRNNQRILDQLCADKIDAKNEKIADLERQLTMANLAASQTAQTAAIRAGQVAEIDAMYNRLRDCPVPTMPVYGSQPIFTCPSSNSGCGCGCNGGF